MKGSQQPAGLRDGRLEIIAGVNPWLSGEAPILNVGHLPGLIADAAEYKQVLDAGLEAEFAKVWLDKYNGVMLSHGVFERQVILMEIGLVTPPVGVNLFVLHGLSRDVALQEIVYGVIPFTLVLAAMVLLLYWLPGLATWLPASMS